MDINLKSSVGRSFSAMLEPTTVSIIMDCQVRAAESRLRSQVLSDLENLSQEELNVNDEYFVSLKDENEMVVEKYSSRYREVQDTFAFSVVEAWTGFRAEYELLKTGSGSERACMEAFVSLCELLQGA